MSLPLIISPGDPGHIGHHEEIHTLLAPVATPFEVASVDQDSLANLPAAGTPGRMYLTTTANRERWYIDNGSDWTAGQIWNDVTEPRYGAVFDGATDDYIAWNAAVGDGGLVYAPGIGTSIVSNQTTVPSNTRIVIERGAEVKMKSTVSGGKAVFLVDDGIENVRFEGGGILDGNKANNATPSSGLFGIKILGASSVYIVDITIRNFPGSTVSGTNGGDGLYVSHSAGGTIPSGIWLDRVVSDGNVRTGMAVISVIGLTAIACNFINTTGTNTGAGVDLEPNNINDIVEDVAFWGCHFDNNAKGAVVQNGAQAAWKNIGFYGCWVRDNSDKGVNLTLQGATAGVTVDDCWILDNGDDGIYLAAGQNGTRIVGNRIQGNAGYGIEFSRGRRVLIVGNNVWANGKDGIWVDFVTGGYLGHRIVHNSIMNNGTLSAGTYHGIKIPGNATHPDHTMTIRDNELGNDTAIGTATQQDGVHFNDSANSTGVKVGPNDYTGLLGESVGGTWTGSTVCRTDFVSRRFITSLRTSAPADADLWPGSQCDWLDEAAGQVKTKVKKLDGSIINIIKG